MLFDNITAALSSFGESSLLSNDTNKSKKLIKLPINPGKGDLSFMLKEASSIKEKMNLATTSKLRLPIIETIFSSTSFSFSKSS